MNHYIIKYRKRFRRKLVDLGEVPFNKVIDCGDTKYVTIRSNNPHGLALRKSKLAMLEFRIAPSEEMGEVLKTIYNYTKTYYTNQGLCCIASHCVRDGAITHHQGECFIEYLYKHKPANAGIYFWHHDDKETRLDFLTAHMIANRVKPEEVDPCDTCSPPETNTCSSCENFKGWETMHTGEENSI